MKRYYWTGRCREARHISWEQLTRVLDRHAIVLHAQQFSDVALGLMLELPADRLAAMRADLEVIASVEGDPLPANAGSRDVYLLLNVSFPDGSGNLAVEVPMVPG